MTTMKSWHNRYTKRPLEIPDDLSHKVAEIEKYVKPSWVPNLYKNLIVANQLYDINFFPIDSPRREEYLRKFNEKYKLGLRTSWRPLNSHGDHTYDIPDDLVTSTKNMMDENKEFFDMFY